MGPSDRISGKVQGSGFVTPVVYMGNRVVLVALAFTSPKPALAPSSIVPAAVSLARHPLAYIKQDKANNKYCLSIVVVEPKVYEVN